MSKAQSYAMSLERGEVFKHLFSAPVGGVNGEYDREDNRYADQTGRQIRREFKLVAKVRRYEGKSRYCEGLPVYHRTKAFDHFHKHPPWLNEKESGRVIFE